ncbi:MAG TPA: hypothetical protein VNH64_06890 [Parvularculaceae bacterium]|nr:hypothetical protein [Parvularculaceae bacterium]
MLSTARVALPANVEVRLKTSSAFVDNVMEFARDDLIGFKRPLAATFALSAPPVLALMLHALGWAAMAKIAAAYFIVASLGLVLVGRQLWPSLVEEYRERSTAKRKAAADLKCGFGEAAFLNLDRSPRFIEHEHGVLAFADAGDFRTLFFSIVNEESDPRWSLYRDGDMDRRLWRWLRLPVSREVVRFSTEGSKLPKISAAPKISSIDAWEAINTALGEPADGAIIHRPFAEVIDMVERMV